MRHAPFITLPQLNAAARHVQRELYRAGLWYEDSRLPGAGIYLIPAPYPSRNLANALGFFIHESTRMQGWLGMEAGHLYIPRWVLSHGFWQNRGSLRDVLRHEYAHAIAHYYPELINDNPRFIKAFGGDYWSTHPCEGPDADFVSAYARTCPMEDFAETFMTYIRHAGKLPKRYEASSPMRRKWTFLDRLLPGIRRHP